VLLLEHYRALRERAGIVDRSARGKIVVAGADRKTYLHAMLTNDIATLEGGKGCYAAFLTPQGRMIADMCVYELGDVCLLDVHPSVKDTVVERLDQFVFSEDVRLGDVTASFASFGVYGPESAEVVAAALRSGDSKGALSAGDLGRFRPFDNVRAPFFGDPVITVAGNRSGAGGFDVYCERRLAEPLHLAFEQAGGIDVGDEAIEAVRIEAGRPEFTVDMNRETIPLEAGIEKDAVSFTKGCYPGQEVVIRILHRGHGRIAKKLAGMVVRDEVVPARGDGVFAADSEIGLVTSAAYSPSLMSPIALGYLARDYLEPGSAITIAHGDRRLAAVVGVLPFVAPNP